MAQAHHATGRAEALLSLGALGVVYGDIGTSPLYTVQTIFAGGHPLQPNAANVYGTTSLIVWSLVMMSGGWLPLVVGAGAFTVLTTWRRGRAVLARETREDRVQLRRYLNRLIDEPPLRVAGTGVFLTNSLDTVPPALLNNVKHNRVLHEQVVLLKFETLGVPHVDDAHRIAIDHLRLGFVGVMASYRFQETPNAVAALKQAARQGLDFNIHDTSYFVSHTSVLRTGTTHLAHWRTLLFTLLCRSSTPPAQYYDMPPDRVFEVGTYVEL